ncbi:hypothetical protein FBD94_17720 [Pedobacter hiemivivus]|uniref:GNAT family N-acetyltransferase n=1 Tax=Pedobacter hiemivivus TaxID=2530454 RepID=A0A4R0MPL3_9SPHI|nr:hypothetical protein [Pedobacter hiemivivus]TCC88467.1 hypothetical protein EZ444_21695 [Pedobacter hiemivivus]TKC58465.1 hypothetical protein FBD94_17720 [Pedobacter hiemivivus]
MNEQSHKTRGVEFRKVYLSDLSAVMRLHQLSQGSITKLTADFGLPLSIAINGNEIIGYGFAAINQLGEVTLNSHCKVVEDLSIGYTLEEQAKKTLHSTFENVGEDNAKFKSSVLRLVDWLNNCY